MRTRLIVLIDFSIYSHALVELGIRWCEIANAQLLLVHQVPGIVPAMTNSESKDEIIKEEKNQALAKLERFATEKVPPSIPVHYHVTAGNLLNSIDELLKQEYNDIILVGIKGTGMFKKILMGSTATEVINEINQLVVAVPDKLCAAPHKFCNLIPRKLIVSLSYKFPLNENAFDNFLTTFKSSLTQIEFISVHSEEKDEKALRYLESLSQKYGERIPCSYKVFNGNDVFDELKKHVRQDNDTTLVVQKGSRNLTDQFFRKFLINQLVHDGSIPLVILPN